MDTVIAKESDFHLDVRTQRNKGVDQIADVVKKRPATGMEGVQWT